MRIGYVQTGENRQVGIAATNRNERVGHLSDSVFTSNATSP